MAEAIAARGRQAIKDHRQDGAGDFTVRDGDPQDDVGHGTWVAGAFDAQGARALGLPVGAADAALLAAVAVAVIASVDAVGSLLVAAIFVVPAATVRLARVRLKAEAPGHPVAEVRAMELLEAIDTADARTLLRELAGGDPTLLRTREASAACQRLKVR